MLVTLPFVLLLLDYWPLGRYQSGPSGAFLPPVCKSSFWGLIREKTPLFILTIASILVTIFAQRQGGSVVPLAGHPMDIRLANALVSYVGYIGKMLWPFDLSIYYPHPGAPSFWKVAVAALFLASISLFAFRVKNRHSYLIVGWLWYLGMLTPVIGLIQVREQALADRYTYAPIIGLFLIIVWGICHLLSGRPFTKAAIAACLVLFFPIIMFAAWKQAGYWVNSYTLYTHAIAVNPGNYAAQNNLGNVWAEKGETEKAIFHYRKALQSNPTYAKAHNNLGVALAEQGKLNEAAYHYRKALSKLPDLKEAHNNLGNVLLQQNKIDEAILHYSRVLKLDYYYARAHINMGDALEKLGKFDKALNHYYEALNVRPGYVEAYFALADAFRIRGRPDKAIDYYYKALDIDPKSAKIHNNLGITWIHKGNYDQAIFHFQEALRINPGDPGARANLDKALSDRKKAMAPKCIG